MRGCLPIVYVPMMISKVISWNSWTPCQPLTADDFFALDGTSLVSRPSLLQKRLFPCILSKRSLKNINKFNQKCSWMVSTYFQVWLMCQWVGAEMCCNWQGRVTHTFQLLTDRAAWKSKTSPKTCCTCSYKMSGTSSNNLQVIFWKVGHSRSAKTF